MSDETPDIPDLRERNMRKRRARILAEARRMIAEHGYDALSTRALAKAAGVTQPTLYNLIGGKNDIIKALLLETFHRVSSEIVNIEGEDLVAWTESTVDKIVQTIEEDPAYYRAALIAGDRNIDLFAENDEAEMRAPFSEIAVALMVATCERQIEQRMLDDRVPAVDLATALYGGLRVNLRDWAYDAISLKTLSRRMRSANYLILAAAAKPALRRKLLGAHQKLDGP